MLQIQSVVKSYAAHRGGTRDRLLVLDTITFSVPKNQFVCLLGASGCGKTTLLRIVAGLVEPDEGAISLEDKMIRGPGQDRSMVFQNYGLLPWRTVMGNVEFSLELHGLSKNERRKICQHYIDRVGLLGFETHYPHQISGGMQQRVALARAYSKDPKLLLMDEPFAAVDEQTRELLQNELLMIWTTMQTTVLFVTHSIDEAIYLSDRVIVMDARPGRIKTDIYTRLQRPRDIETKTSVRFNELRRELREALRHGGTIEG